MAARLKNVTTANDYASSATVQQPETQRVLLQVANAAVYYQLDTSDRGDGAWDAESFLLPSMGPIARRCSGIRFRSAAAGVPAQVSADLLNAEDLAQGSDNLAPFGDHVSAAGVVTGQSIVTGIVAGNGTITAGSGFAVNRTGPGVYVVTFSASPFSSAPLVLAQVTDPVALTGFTNVRSITPAGFTMLTYNSGAGAADLGFMFSAQAVA